MFKIHSGLDEKEHKSFILPAGTWSNMTMEILSCILWLNIPLRPLFPIATFDYQRESLVLGFIMNHSDRWNTTVEDYPMS
jgi:hypothetical protein